MIYVHSTAKFSFIFGITIFSVGYKISLNILSTTKRFGHLFSKYFHISMKIKSYRVAFWIHSVEERSHTHIHTHSNIFRLIIYCFCTAENFKMQITRHFSKCENLLPISFRIKTKKLIHNRLNCIIYIYWPCANIYGILHSSKTDFEVEIIK